MDAWKRAYSTVRWSFGAVIAILMLFAAHGTSAIFVRTLYTYIGYLVYPAHFAAGLLLAWLVLLLRHWRPVIWWRRQMSNKFETKQWLKVRKWGAIPFTFVACFWASPAVAAAAILLLNVEERKAWKYIGWSMLVTSAFWVSFYLGLVKVIFG